MKQLSFKKNLLLLRISILSLILTILVLFLFSFTVPGKLVDEVWKQLGISQQQGTDKIRSSFMNGYLDHYGIRNVKNLAAGNRAGATQDLLVYAKRYLNSAAFKALYEKERIAARPAAPGNHTRTLEELRKDKIGEMQKSIKSGEEMIRQLPGMEKSLRPSIELFKKTAKEYEKPGNKTIEAYYQYEQREYEQQVERHKQDLLRWQKDFPADPNQRLGSYLVQYLEVAATVDFNAALKDQDGKKRFVNPAYEGKNDNWKMIYRAGKEVYDVARPFAEQWLKETR